jgi:hypothetical protein
VRPGLSRRPEQAALGDDLRFGTSKSASTWPREQQNTLPAPYRRFQKTGITVPAIQGACSSPHVAKLHDTEE